jgi:hypothetical protein
VRLRRNKGRRLWPDVRRLLSVVLDREVQDDALLTLEATAELRERFNQRLQGRDYKSVSRAHGATAAVWGEIARLATQLPEREVVLLHDNDRYTGAIRLGLREVLANAPRVWGALGVDLCVLTAAAEDGLLLGSYHDHPADVLELVVWGMFTSGQLLLAEPPSPS